MHNQFFLSKIISIIPYILIERSESYVCVYQDLWLLCLQYVKQTSDSSQSIQRSISSGKTKILKLSLWPNTLTDLLN